MLVRHGSTYGRVHPWNLQLKNDSNIRSRDSIDSPTSEYENWAIQSKDQNALASKLRNWQNIVIFENKNTENKYEQ